jgi:gamma-glutamyltranspeptidase
MQWLTSGNTFAPHCAAASSSRVASAVGLDIMNKVSPFFSLFSFSSLIIHQKGGNAADACVAMAAVLNVCEPTSTGIGGDVFVLYWDETKKKCCKFILFYSKKKCPFVVRFSFREQISGNRCIILF